MHIDPGLGEKCSTCLVNGLDVRRVQDAQAWEGDEITPDGKPSRGFLLF
jgi:hypothetical protein